MVRRRTREGTRRRSASRGVQISYQAPPVVLLKLDQRVLEEGCSRSWLITEFICAGLGMDEKEIAAARGYSIPKRLEDRVGDWTPNKDTKEVDDTDNDSDSKVKVVRFNCSRCGQSVKVSGWNADEVAESYGGICISCRMKEGRSNGTNGTNRTNGTTE